MCRAAAGSPPGEPVEPRRCAGRASAHRRYPFRERRGEKSEQAHRAPVHSRLHEGDRADDGLLRDHRLAGPQREIQALQHLQGDAGPDPERRQAAQLLSQPARPQPAEPHHQHRGAHRPHPVQPVLRGDGRDLREPGEERQEAAAHHRDPLRPAGRDRDDQLLPVAEGRVRVHRQPDRPGRDLGPVHPGRHPPDPARLAGERQAHRHHRQRRGGAGADAEPPRQHGRGRARRPRLLRGRHGRARHHPPPPGRLQGRPEGAGAAVRRQPVHPDGVRLGARLPQAQGAPALDPGRGRDLPQRGAGAGGPGPALPGDARALPPDPLRGLRLPPVHEPAGRPPPAHRAPEPAPDDEPGLPALRRAAAGGGQGPLHPLRAAAPPGSVAASSRRGGAAG